MEIVYLDESTSLTHHGIKGQKWGIRHYQNRDGTLTQEGKRHYRDLYNRIVPPNSKDGIKRYKEVRRQKLYDLGLRPNYSISKGSVLYRVADSGEPIDKKRKYVSLSPKDAWRYVDYANEGALRLKDPTDTTLYEYETKKDVNVADAETVSEYMLNNYGRDFDTMRARAVINSMKDLDVMQDYRIKNSDLSKKDKKFALSVYEKFEQSERAVNRCLSTLGDESILSKAVTDFTKMGYDAMVDVEDVLISELPMILFNPENNIKLLSKYSGDNIYDFLDKKE